MRGRHSEVGKVELGAYIREKDDSCPKKGFDCQAHQDAQHIIALRPKRAFFGHRWPIFSLPSHFLNTKKPPKNRFKTKILFFPSAISPAQFLSRQSLISGHWWCMNAAVQTMGRSSPILPGYPSPSWGTLPLLVWAEGSKSPLLTSCYIQNRSILFVDDCITSGTTRSGKGIFVRLKFLH